VKRRAMSAHAPQLAARGPATSSAGAPNSPIIVLSYAYAGAEHVQNALAVGSRLACTSGTGILPQCATAAETWRRIESQQGTTMSRLAAAATRQLVTAQITAILASSGQPRWCELATAAPDAAETFLQVFPHAHFVCVHRCCLDVIRAGVQANPWGLQGHGFTPFVLAYPGNSVAALAADWATSAEQLLAFERANQQAAHGVRYEDVTTQPDQALAAVRLALRLGDTEGDDVYPVQPEWLAEPGDASAEADATVPAEMIPEPLRQRISHLHAELGYPPLEVKPLGA
jgi:Sulfotransferase family